MMTAKKNPIQIFFLLALAFLLFTGVGISDDTSITGPSIGRVVLISGNVVIVHAGSQQEYLAAKGVSLYDGDTLTSGSKSRISMRLNDESTITMGSDAKLTLSRNIYDPDKKVRTSFLKMTIGKARFWVQKYTGYKRSDFRIKTPTAVAGVRGSDFTIFVTEADDLFTAFEDTVLEVASLKFPDEKPSVLRDFEQTRVRPGQRPSPVLRLPVSHIKQIMREFPLDRHVDLPKKPVKPAKYNRPENAPDSMPKLQMPKNDHTGKASDSMPKLRMPDKPPAPPIPIPSTGTNINPRPQEPPTGAIIRETIADQKNNARRPKEIIIEKPVKNNRPSNTSTGNNSGGSNSTGNQTDNSGNSSGS